MNRYCLEHPFLNVFFCDLDRASRPRKRRIDVEIRQINHRMTTMLVGQQQAGHLVEQQKKFFTLVGELTAAGSLRTIKQENLLLARASQSN